MPNYAYNVVYRDGDARPVEWHPAPTFFAGGPAEFARQTLLAWLAAHDDPDTIVVVNVWDTARPGAMVPGNIAAQLSNHGLDEGPFAPNQIYAEYFYFVQPTAYNPYEDPTLGSDGSYDASGLIVPGTGPALRIHAGDPAWITLDVVRLDAAPAPDTERWDAIEQATVRTPDDLRVVDAGGRVRDQYPDLVEGLDSRYVTVRVSVRGRDRIAPLSRTHPRRRPQREHLIEAWPAADPAPRLVVKRG